jgi:hypothetical protein
MKTKPAINSLRVTKRMGPNTTADIFINIKALPQMAANAVNKIQSFNSIDKYQL